MKRRICAVLCAVCLLFTLIPNVFAASDINGHWAQSDMEVLSALGVMKGYPDGTFKPNNSITKAEYITLLNRVFGLTAVKSVSATDLSSSKWYYDEIRKAAAAGYLFTSGGKVEPDKALTREEAAAMFGLLLDLPTSASATSFTDDSAISARFKPYITAVAAAKIISGYPDGSFHPTETITRAEVCRVLINVCGSFYAKAGAYSGGGSAKNHATVTAAGVVMNNVSVTGNLYITGGVGTGTVTLNNCSIGGEIIALGNPGATVCFTGTTKAASVDADGLKIQVSGRVDELRVSADSTGAAVNVGADAALSLLQMNCAGSVTGQVGHLSAAVSGVSASVLPEKWTLAPGVSIVLAGKTYTVSGTKGPGFSAGYPKAAVGQSADGLNQEIVVTLKVDEPAYVYCIAVPRGSTAPTDAQVKAMTNYGMVSLSANNFTAVTVKNTELKLTLTNLPVGALFDVYIVAESMDSVPKLGTAVKLTPSQQITAAGYPDISAVSEYAATVRIRTLTQANVRMMAVPAGSTAPTQEQLLAQAGVANAVYFNASVPAGVEQALTISGLTRGFAAYDLYVGVGAPGSSELEISKFTLANEGNAVSVQYSVQPTGGAYPGHTTLTLQFHDTMYKAGTTTQMGMMGASPAELITVTGVNTYTGAAAAVAGYTATLGGNGIVILTPPSGGWTDGVKYTVSLAGLTDAAGRSPVPSQITFTVGTQAAVSTPVVSLATGSLVTPGQEITISTQTANAVIQYTTDGSDPTLGGFSSQYGSKLTLTIPSTAIVGQTYRFRAVARLDTVYSQPVDVWYTVGQPVSAPYVTNAITGALLSMNGETLESHSSIDVTTLDEDAVLYYTFDGTQPMAIGTGLKNFSLYVTGNTGEVRILKVLVVSGGTSQTYTYNFVIGSAPAAEKLSAPIMKISGSQPIVSGATYSISNTDDLLIYSFNNINTTQLYYTLDGSDPTVSATRMTGTGMSLLSHITVNLDNMVLGSKVKVQAVVYSGTLARYSDIVSVTLSCDR